MAYVNNASQIAYDFINEQIELGHWRPGSRIWTEARICQHLGVSRVAVRQAIDRLATLNILYKRQGSGTFVKKDADFGVMDMGFNGSGDDELLDILEFRRYFEYGNIIMFVKNATEADIRALEDSYVSMKRAAASDDMKTFYTADYLFHDIIARGTKKTFIFRISTTLNSVLSKHQAGLNARIGPAIGLEYHANILDSVRKRDADLAALYMQRHIDVTIQAVKDSIEKGESGRQRGIVAHEKAHGTI